MMVAQAELGLLIEVTDKALAPVAFEDLGLVAHALNVQAAWPVAALAPFSPGFLSVAFSQGEGSMRSTTELGNFVRVAYLVNQAG